MSQSICPDTNTEFLHKKIESLNDICFPMKTRKIRSTDKPWIDDNIRRKIRERMRAYKKHGRKGKWLTLKEGTSEAIAKNKRVFYEQEVKKLGMPGAIPYKSLHRIIDTDAPKNWTPKMMKPDMNELQIAEDLADFFTRITDEFSPL